MVSGIVNEDVSQLNIFEKKADNKDKALMKTIDDINKEMGKNIVRTAIQDMITNGNCVRKNFPHSTVQNG